MKTIENITVTDGRLKKAINNNIAPLIMPKVDKQIKEAITTSKIKIGVMTKFYPHLDKCEVNINDKLILCKILHRFGGELIDFYTPNGDEYFCDKLKEPCIIPRGELECLILDVDDNTNERIMIGYFLPEELIGSNPASMGNVKLSCLTGTNEYWIKFGCDGLDIRSPELPVTNIGEFDDDMAEITNVNSNDVYTKSETEELIKSAIDELKHELGVGEM